MEIFIGRFVGLALGVLGTALVMRSRAQSDLAVLQERLSAREAHGKEQQQAIESHATELATARERITALTANEGVLKTRLADEQNRRRKNLQRSTMPRKNSATRSRHSQPNRSKTTTNRF